MKSHLTGSELKKATSGVEITLAGRAFHLALDFNAICDIQERYGSLEKGMDTIGGGEDGREANMKDVRFLLCCMLRHEEEEMTEYETGRLITIQNMQEIMDKLGQAMAASQSETEEKNVQSPQEK